MKAISLFIGLFCVTVFGFSQNITRWRGVNGNGIYNDHNLLNSWPESGPEIVWHFDDLGIGFSSPAFDGNKIYITGMNGSNGVLYVLSLKGELILKKEYGPEWETNYNGTRSTVTVAGDRLYIYSGLGVLYCLDANSGNKIWQKDMMSDFDGKNIEWGVTESVVVDGEMVYCTPGGLKNNVVALNRLNGNLIWSCAAAGNLSAYCTPLLVEHNARKILVTMTAANIVGIDAKTGKMLWKYEQKNRWSVHANTPVYSDGSLYCVSGYGCGGVKLRLNQSGDSVTKEWFNATLDNRFGGVVVMNGYAYGSGDKNRQWQCVDFTTGMQKYTLTTIGPGAIIAADGKLYVYSQTGELGMLKPESTGFNQLAVTKVMLGSGQHWAHPVIFDGLLYVRHGNSLIAYKIK